MDSISGLGRSPGGGHGNPLQYSCLENPMDRGAWWATAHGVAKSQTRLMVTEHITHLIINSTIYIYIYICHTFMILLMWTHGYIFNSLVFNPVP